MKRPDAFLGVNSANVRKLSDGVGFAQSALKTFDGYWELHEVLWRCPWHRAKRPSGIDGRLWDARVALIDAFYYVPASG